VHKASEQGQEPADLNPFEPPLRLTLDEAAKRPYNKLRWHLENAPSVLVGVANDGTLLGNAQVLLSDLLGDNRMIFDFQSVSTFSNFFYQYLNVKNRTNWGLFARDYRDYYIAQSISGGIARTNQSYSTTAAGADVSWPFNRYYRISGLAGYTTRSYTRPFLQPDGSILYLDTKEQFPFVGWALDGDTVRWQEWGPYHGQRYQIAMQWTPAVQFSGDTGSGSGSAINTQLDYRLYRRVTGRSLFAIRLADYNSNGDAYSIYSLGGLNYLRGYDFREFYGNRVAFANVEFRFPLVDAIAFPIGILRDIRGFAFLDVGAAWFQGDLFTHPQMTPYLTVASAPLSFYAQDANGNVIPRTFEFWDSKNDKLGDGRAAYGFGFNVFLGPFQLTWVYAHQLDNTVEVCDTPIGGVCTPQDIKRIDDPTHRSGSIGQFYIAIDY
jgi:hypothetical protein